MIAKPKFAIVRMIPQHDDRDAITGWRGERQPMIYLTAALALRLAQRQEDEGSEVCHEVRDLATGKRVFSAQPSAPELNDSIPF